MKKSNWKMWRYKSVKDTVRRDEDYAEVIKYIKDFQPSSYDYVVSHLDRLLFTASCVTHKFPTSAKILDIGSHPFFLPGYLSLKGYENISVVDIDRPDDFPLDPRWGVQSCKLDIEEQKWPYEDGYFDVIMLLEVFEHLYKKPNHVFREIQRVLKPNGVLLISTPNGWTLRSILRFLIKQRSGHRIYSFSQTYEKLGHFDHIREYSVSEIKEYLGHFALSIDEKVLSTFYASDISDDGKAVRTYPARNKLLKFIGKSFSFIQQCFWFLPILQDNIFIVVKKTS